MELGQGEIGIYALAISTAAIQGFRLVQWLKRRVKIKFYFSIGLAEDEKPD